MKIQASSAAALKLALHKASKCIENKPSMAILANVLLTQRRDGDGKFFFISATSDSQLTIPAPFSIVEGKYSKDIVLPVAMLTSFIGTLPGDCVVTFDISEDSQDFTIEYCTGDGENVKTGKVSLGYDKADDFPLARKIGDEYTEVVFPMSVFKSVLGNAGKFVAADELRPVMNCLCIDVTEDFSEAVFVASDGHKLFKQIHPNKPEQGGSDFYRQGAAMKILVHSQYLKVLSVFEDCEDINIQCDGKMVRFASGDIEYVCTLVDGKYPNYNSVIPKDTPYYAVCNKRELLSIIKRISLFSSESSKLISMKKDGMFLDISAQDIDFSVSGEDQVLVTDSECPEGFLIGFSWLTLMDSVNAIPTENVRLNFIDKSRAITVTEDNPASKVTTLVMPMLLND